MYTELQFGTREINGWLRRQVSIIRDKQEDVVLWIEVPTAYGSWLVQHEDPLLCLAMFHIMEYDGECRIRADIDRMLLENLTEFMRIWKLWCPHVCHCPALIPDAVVERVLPANRDEAICAFSGGVDASFTLLSHLEKFWGDLSLKIPAAVMLHGADIYIKQEKEFDRAYAHARECLEQLRIELIPMRTNYREYPHNWNYCHCAVVVSALSLLGERFCRGLYGSTDVASRDVIMNSIPFGMNYVTEHLLNSSSFVCQAVGSDVSRTERCAFISQSEPIMRHLRVCWQKHSEGGNCGVCEKCMRTALNFMVTGYKGALPFKQSFSLEHFRRTPIEGSIPLAALREVLAVNDKTHALPDELRRVICRKLAWAERKKMVKSCLVRISPRMVDILKRFMRK